MIGYSPPNHNKYNYNYDKLIKNIMIKSLLGVFVEVAIVVVVVVFVVPQ